MRFKTVVTAAPKTQFINIPRISMQGSGTYRSWLATLLISNHNRKALSRSEKEVVDGLFQRQAEQQFKLDNSRLKQAMNDMVSKSSKDFFANRKSVFRGSYNASDAEAVEVTSALSIPIITPENGVQSRDVWKNLSYEKFARRFERQNPNVALTKHIVDTAFRKAVSRSPSGIPSNGREQTILRCLGKESTKYWKNK